jgi:DGQHR domain-containing protein
MVITLSINFEELMRVIVADNFSHTLKRAQRELNLRRTSAFSNYVLAALQDDHEYIVPPLIGNIDGDVVVTPSPEYPGFGTITIPMSAKITLFDGQHRNAGIMEVCRQFANLTSETVTLELSLNQPLLTQQQFFPTSTGTRPNQTQPSIWPMTIRTHSASWLKALWKGLVVCIPELTLNGQTLPGRKAFGCHLRLSATRQDVLCVWVRKVMLQWFRAT